ncbi:bifunctional oligoribonuclease/PAP phosphatase NrnA [Nakamurella sp. YIM 132087]|uniref:Bifunctional oligoribonuclease/PAP phosphatase NrnA n=1 Tax=Nakamurella alba TaxID=2665158 RepID=A0A7K1FI12_9ACTN|nr:bifunctional oligoribonuclease/PAP phosphatase NrnA [Nakamurella alba]MTD13720.1 bifunctional oligoribonuclease/PAP phosphatase NrnA [Nakamurella alba]
MRTSARARPAGAPSRFDDADLSAAAALLEDASSVVILAHVNPDADALGSALALGLALSRNGCTVQVAFAEPAEIPESLAGLAGAELVVPADDVDPTPGLLVTVDVNSRARLGRLGALVDTTPRTLVVDHHASNTRFGSDHVVDVTAESTTVLIAALLDRMGLPIDTDIAENLYAGLATDTVGFRHSTGAGHRLAGRLLDVGVSPDELMRPITDTHPEGWLGMLAAVLGRAEVVTASTGTRVVWTWITTEDAAGLRSEELDSVIDIVRTTKGTQVAAVFKQAGPAHWQVSLRSLPGTDVSAVATVLGGGGHVRAAGYSCDGTIGQARERLLAALSG